MNRIATDSDIARWQGIKPGDWIFDTPTRNNSLNYYFVNDELKGLTGTPTFWLDGDGFGGMLNEIKFQHTANELPWVVDRVRFKNLPGTRVTSRAFSCKGLKHFELSGEDETFTGIRHWPSSRKFLTRNFGFDIMQGMKGHCFDIAVQDGGSITMRGFEAQGGFAGLRLQQKNEAITIDGLTLENFYIHDTRTGEGQYIGSTVRETATPKFKNVRINNGIIARAAAEALQLQHMAGSDVCNITIFCADTAWLGAFQPNQSTGIQFTAAEGLNRLRNILVDGYANPGLNPFSVSAIDFKGEGLINTTFFDDILMYGGRGCGSYLNQSMRNGIWWKFNNIMFGGFDDSWYRNTGNQVKPLIHSGAITDKVTFGRVIYDGSRGLATLLFDKDYSVKELIEQPIPAPQYRNSGFHEPAQNIMQWAQYYASYFDGMNNTPTVWEPGFIAIHVDDYAFYKCINPHTSTDVPPPNNPNFVKLTWDSEGIRSDQEGWNSILAQSNYPPDDLRLVPGSPYSHLGIQIREEIIEEYIENGRRVTITNAGNRY